MLGTDEQGVTGVRLNSTVGAGDLEKEVTGVFLAVGHTPNTAFLEGKLELTESRYVRWTQPGRTNTSVEGVFCGGGRGGQLLSAGDHRGRDRLYGRVGCRTLAGDAIAGRIKKK